MGRQVWELPIPLPLLGMPVHVSLPKGSVEKRPIELRELQAYWSAGDGPDMSWKAYTISKGPYV